MTRCPWAESNELQTRYHDTEWGLPVHDDRRFFEFLLLEGAQAGLSWDTVLRKREGYRAAFADFDPQAVARIDDADLARLLADPSIVRNRLKVAGAVRNARAFLAVQAEFGRFSDYVWGFVDGAPLQNHRREMSEIPASTPLSDALSKDLKRRGFTFVGTTICYAFLQATGLVNDHLVDCFRYREVQAGA